MKAKIRNFIQNFQDMDKILFYVTMILFIFGLFNIVTASSSEAVIRYEKSLFYYFFRQLGMIVLGLIASLFIINKETKKYSFYAIIGFLAITACVLCLFLYGSFHKGAQNWLSIGPIKFQPSEFVKPITIVCLAIIFEKTKSKVRNKKKTPYDIIGVILFVGLFNPIIIYLEKDLGTMMIIMFVFFMMFLASPILKQYKIKTMIFLLIVALSGLLVVQPSHSNR